MSAVISRQWHLFLTALLLLWLLPRWGAAQRKLLPEAFFRSPLESTVVYMTYGPGWLTPNGCKHKTDVFFPQVRQKMDISSWTSGTISWFWVALLILFSECNCAFTRVDAGLCNVGLTSCWEGHGCFVPPSHMSSRGQSLHYTFTWARTQWGKQWTAWMSVSRWSALLFCPVFCPFCKVFKLSADWTPSGR